MGPLELELQMAESSDMGVGPVFGSSAKAGSDLYCYAISPAPQFISLLGMTIIVAKGFFYIQGDNGMIRPFEDVNRADVVSTFYY